MHEGFHTLIVSLFSSFVIISGRNSVFATIQYCMRVFLRHESSFPGIRG